MDDHPELIAEIARMQDRQCRLIVENERLADALAGLVSWIDYDITAWQPHEIPALITAIQTLEEWRKSRAGENNEEKEDLPQAGETSR